MLTDLAIRKLKTPEKPTKIYMGKGLFLLHTPAGGKLWRFKYRYAGKEKVLAIGTYPQKMVKKACDDRDAARKLLDAGIDPGQERKIEKTAAIRSALNTFEAVGRLWFEGNRSNWVESHAKKIISQLERDVFPYLGKRPIADITPADVLEALGKIRDRGDESLGHKGRGLHETARRAFGNCGMIFRFAVKKNLIKSDPTRDLKGDFPKMAPKHFAAITNPEEIGQLMRAIEGYNGSMIVRAALKLSALFFARPGEIRHSRWEHVDLDAGVFQFWVSKRVKSRDEPILHVVPLCHQAIAILRELHNFTGAGEYVFPSARSFARPMSNNAVLAAIRAMGFGKETMTAHGFRAMALTRLRETLKVPVEVVEKQLTHAVPDMNGTAYNRTQFLDDRRRMMQEWADYLDGLKNGNIRLGKVA
ncbi:MAG TPA: integrase arm-type DNA-binding domain-containing protein [Candidatus Ozemobacteraceae bacterium]|nr:integrase arm-type DNA-binding domain-containing protein [Candidatus Ozemobacteraceae bacterium]